MTQPKAWSQAQLNPAQTNPISANLHKKETYGSFWMPLSLFLVFYHAALLWQELIYTQSL